jgi:chitin disaccharide deacetylase
MHHVVLCADDFGLTEGVSRGILDLARQGRLSATSVMSHRPWWRTLAPDLAGLGGPLGVGLHLTLSLGQPLGAMRQFAPDGVFPAFADVLRKSLLRQLPSDEIGDEIKCQLSAFEAAFGRPPDFVDGHQHVHVLPGVREPLLAVLEARGWRGRLWLRDPSDRIGAILRRRVAAPKALLVRGLSTGFRAAAQRTGFAVNDGFSGFSPFDPARDAATDFERFFQDLGPRPVVMCHPGHADAELHGLDAVVATREREYAYLTSDDFSALLKERAISLVPSPG